MTIRKIHSNDVTENRADIATQYTEIYFDDATNSILLPDPTGLLETKIGAVTSSKAGPMNVATYTGPVTNITGIGQIIAQYTFTSNGNPVLCIANGDGNPINPGGNYCRVQWFRDGVAIGNIFHLENNQSINPSYCITVLDTPTAGAHTYSLRTVPGAWNGQWGFGEGAGPQFTFVELAGAIGPQGIAGKDGAGATNTTVQNTITLGGTTTAPVTGTRTAQRLESQVFGDKVKLTYKLAYAGGNGGNGHYLLSLPTGMSFNQTYNPWTTANEWTGDVQTQGIYNIPAAGGIIIPGGWCNQFAVVPYDSTRFRLLVTYNGQAGQFYYWGSGFYSAGTNTSLNIQFEIWK